MFNDTSHNNFPSMGIYVINRDVMVKLLREYLPKSNDLRSEVVPAAISLGMKVIRFFNLLYYVDRSHHVSVLPFSFLCS